MTEKKNLQTQKNAEDFGVNGARDGLCSQPVSATTPQKIGGRGWIKKKKIKCFSYGIAAGAEAEWQKGLIFLRPGDSVPRRRRKRRLFAE